MSPHFGTRVLDAEQMRAADARACERLGEVALMRAAGEAVAELTRTLDPSNGKLVAFAGPGNNGGDAFAAAAELARERPCVVHAMEAPRPSAARSDAEERARNAGVEIRPLPGTDAAAFDSVQDAALALDGLLGVGARPEPPAGMHASMAALSSLARRSLLGDRRVHTIAIDLPSGVDASSGAFGQHVAVATDTLMIGAPKLGALLEPSRSIAGRPWVGDIGMLPEVEALEGPVYATIERDFFRGFYVFGKRRSDDADKRSAGAPLIVAGSKQFPGAAVLAARGAARAGAGYVTVACPEDAAAAVRAHLIEQVVVTYDPSDPDAAVATIVDLTNHCGSIALGPGLGLAEGIGRIVRGIVERAALPMVADAGALFHFAKHLEILRGKPIVLTPHAGEFARLSGAGTIAAGERLARLRNFVERTGVATLLKGSATLIADDGLTYVNSTGTPVLATAGTGDVLTGMIATLLAQGVRPPGAAAALAAYWHGLAARQAERERPRGVVAGDVAEALGPSLRPLLEDRERYMSRPTRRVAPLY